MMIFNSLVLALRMRSCFRVNRVPCAPNDLWSRELDTTENLH